jgi:hypothetical protein
MLWFCLGMSELDQISATGQAWFCFTNAALRALR